MMYVTVASARQTPPLRRDAERNRERILAAAQVLFAQRGLDATLDDIAREAGVGIGTVYRRFANKEELVDALFEDKLAGVLEVGEAALAHEDAWDGLVLWVEGVSGILARDRGLKAVLLSEHGRDRFARARAQIVPLASAIVQRAKDAGVVRPDLAVTDIPVLEFMLTSAAELTEDVDPDLWRRYLVIVLDGLRVRRDAPSLLPVAPMAVGRLVDTEHKWR